MYIGLLILEQFARSGGGGSSSGGGGGGDGGAVFALLGYFPSYYLGKLIKKLLPRKPELIVSAIAASIFSVALVYIGVQMGFLGVYIVLLVIGGIWAGWAAAFFGVWDKLRKKAKQTSSRIDAAASQDPAWDKDQILEQAKKIFMRFQADWTNMATEQFAHYQTASYATHNQLFVRALRELHRVNYVNNPVINEALIVDMVDSPYDAQDTFTVAFHATADDALYDTDRQDYLFRDTKPFTEFWTFQRDDTSWRLAHIDQNSADYSTLNRQLQNFAVSNGMHYSLDMGWLFMPRYGALFAKGRFGNSDINNHVIGTYHDHLVQFYTFRSIMFKRQQSRVKAPDYVVGQINLPKSYGGIYVRPRIKKFLGMPLKQTSSPNQPRDYIPHTFEWPDFNDRYEVFATDPDRLATFELINPGFMAWLYDFGKDIHIEVTDNIVYLYIPTMLVKSQDYDRMLQLMLKAYKELQL